MYEWLSVRGSFKAQPRPSLGAAADPGIHILTRRIVHLELYSTTSDRSGEVGCS